jgi:hypothetical protein
MTASELWERARGRRRRNTVKKKEKKKQSTLN